MSCVFWKHQTCRACSETDGTWCQCIGIFDEAGAMVNVRSWNWSVRGAWVLRPCQQGTANGVTVSESGVGLAGDFGPNVPWAEATSVDVTLVEVTSANEEAVQGVVLGAWAGWAVAEAQVGAAGLMLPLPPGRQSDLHPCDAWPSRHRRGSQTRCRQSHARGGCGYGLAGARRFSPHRSIRISPAGGHG